MFYRQESDQYINEGTTFFIDGAEYPPQWLNQSTPEQKADLGLVEVVQINQPANGAYYWVQEVLNGAELSYTNTPKDLSDVQKQAIAQVNSIAYSILFSTDWMVVKAFETSTPIAADWNTWRASIRTTAADTVTAVNAATDVAQVETIMGSIVWANDPNYVEVPSEVI